MSTRNSFTGYRRNRPLVSFASLIAGVLVGLLIATSDCVFEGDIPIPLIVAYPFLHFVLPGFLVGRKATSRTAADLFFDTFFVSVFGAAKAALTSILVPFLLSVVNLCELGEASGYYMWAVLILTVPLSPIAGVTSVVTARWFRAKKLRAAHGELWTRPDR